MQPRTAPVEEFRDFRFRVRRLQQFQARVAGADEMRPHALRLDVFGKVDLEPERVAIERERGRKIADGDADVVEARLYCHRAMSAAAAVYGSSSRAAIRDASACSSPGASTRRSIRSMNSCVN